MAATPITPNTAPDTQQRTATQPARDLNRSGQADPLDGFIPANATCECARGTDLTGQVSFIIKHLVKPDKHPEYEEWLRKTIAIAAKHPGHMGAHVARPGDGDHLYQISVRFASREDAEDWERSDDRHKLIEEVADLIQEPETLDIRSGIDYWFTAATENHVSPPRWKQWLLTLSAVWPLSMILSVVLGRVFAAVPALGRFGVAQLVTGVVLVFLLTYVVMPPYTRAVRKWLSRG